MLLLVDGVHYNDLILKTVKSLSKGSICYITLNKTYESLKEHFKKNRINLKNIVFIDAISPTLKKTPKEMPNCYFVSSPAALTELAIVIDKFLEHKFDYLIFDSLTNLMIYQKKAHVAKFILSVINKIRAGKTKAIFYALKVEEHEALIEETGMFADKVIEWSSK